MANNIDLVTLFKAVTDNLSRQQSSLNEADTYNHDHGDHMVQIFQLIQSAVEKKSDLPVADQLAYASKEVEKKAESGSGKLYAEGLANAAKSLTGSNNLTADNVGVLVKSLLNVEDKGGSEKSGGLLGGLLSTLAGGDDSKDQKLGMDDLLRAGLAFYQSKQDGDSNTEAVMDALMAASPLGESAHRSQSGSIVAATLMDFAKNLTN